MQVAGARPLVTDASRLVRTRGERRELALARRIDERLDAHVVALAGLREQLVEVPPARRPARPPERISFVWSFASWTFGWSNGLISRIVPATAVANSQR